MPELNDMSQLSAMITIIVNGHPRSFSSSVMCKAGQESLMLDLAWRQTRKQVEEALKCQQED